jgi:hypothetical protein
VAAVEELVCAECGREPRAGENAEDEWRVYLDVDDDLPVVLPAVRRARASAHDRAALFDF